MKTVFVVLGVVLCSSVVEFRAEATWSWFTSPRTLPSLTLPDECGARVFVYENKTAQSAFEEKIGEKDSGHVKLTDAPWPWVVRVGDGAVGVLLTQQHAVTLAHCLQNHTAWYGGFYTFSIKVVNKVFDVPRVRVQVSEGGRYPLALLTLEENLTWIPAPACVGTVQDSLLAAAVGWGEEDLLRQEPISFHRKGQCKDFFREDYDDSLMICGGPGPADCGAPLLQADDGRWMLVGIGVGDKTPVARYVQLEPSREWMENA